MAIWTVVSISKSNWNWNFNAHHLTCETSTPSDSCAVLIFLYRSVKSTAFIAFLDIPASKWLLWVQFARAVSLLFMSVCEFISRYKAFFLLFKIFLDIISTFWVCLVRKFLEFFVRWQLVQKFLSVTVHIYSLHKKFRDKYLSQIVTLKIHCFHVNLFILPLESIFISWLYRGSRTMRGLLYTDSA